MTAPLRFPTPDWRPEALPKSFPDPRLAPALLVTVLLCWGFWLVGYFSGRSAERGSQLAVVAGMVVRGPTIDSLADSSRAVLQRFTDATRRPKTGPRMPQERRGATFRTADSLPARPGGPPP